MALINHVYAHTKVAGFAVHKRDSSVIWSQKPLEGCDAYAYSNAFSFCGKQAGQDILLMSEPTAVLPGQYRAEIWQNFDRVLTWVDTLANRGGMFHKMVLYSYDMPYDHDYTRAIDLSYRLPPAEKKKAICMINGNKFSSAPGELYSKRVEIAQWFHDHSAIPFDVYGTPPFKLPNYIGSLSPYTQKFKTLAGYRYCLSFENIYHPVWSKGGGGDEKLHDCFMCGTVPIYLGCYDIEKYVPTNCFIDFRDFRNYAELDRFLQNISDTQYKAYLDRIEDWVQQGGLQRYSINRLYDKLLALSVPELEESDIVDEPWRPGLADDHRNRGFNLINEHPLWSWRDLATAPMPQEFTGVEPNCKSKLAGSTIMLEADDAFSHTDLAEIYYDRGNYEEARIHYARAAELKPQSVTYQRNLADFYLVAEKNLGKSLEIYRKVAVMRPTDAEVLLMAGNLSHALGNLGEAQGYFERILRTDPSNTEARNKLHDILLKDDSC